MCARVIQNGSDVDSTGHARPESHSSAYSRPESHYSGGGGGGGMGFFNLFSG